MGLLAERLSRRLPKRFPVGAKYVVEGRPGRHGELRLLARYVVLPDGRRINVPADPGRPQAPTGRRSLSSAPTPAKTAMKSAGKKLAAAGTDCGERH